MTSVVIGDFVKVQFEGESHAQGLLQKKRKEFHEQNANFVFHDLIVIKYCFSVC